MQQDLNENNKKKNGASSQSRGELMMLMVPKVQAFVDYQPVRCQAPVVEYMLTDTNNVSAA